MKWTYIVGIVILVILISVTLPANIRTRNLGLDGGVNGFFAGGIMNVISLILIFVALFFFVKKKKVHIPGNLVPINDND